MHIKKKQPIKWQTYITPQVRSPISESPWQEALQSSPTSPTQLRVAMESRPPRPPSLPLGVRRAQGKGEVGAMVWNTKHKI